MKDLFSEREGFKPTRVDIQIESMDRDLKVGLWNDLYACFFEDKDYRSHFVRRDTDPLLYSLWDKFFSRELDRIPKTGRLYVYEVKERFTSLEWIEVYDLIEAVLRLSHSLKTNAKYVKRCNETLEDKNAGYHLINNLITPITCKVEIEEIEKTLNSASRQARDHIAQALEHLSDRESPDYRNSIKESISAVETLCCLIAGKQKASLGEAVNLISKSEVVNFHPAFAEALKKLYGWTNDADGIRHSLMEESSLSQEDARFMLVSCSTFTNYLTVKADKAGIELRQ